MADQVGGFIGGYSQAGQDIDAHQQSVDAHQQSQLALAKGGLELKQTEMLLAASQQFAKKMQDLNTKGGNPGTSGTSGITDQLHQSAEMSFAMGNSLMSSGLPAQGNEYIVQGAKLAENAAKIQTEEATNSRKMWGTIGSLVNGLGENASPEQIDQATFLFQSMYPEQAKHPEVQKVLEKMHDPQTREMLKRASLTAVQQADEQLKQVDIKKADAEIQATKGRTAYEQQATRVQKERADALQKQGGVKVDAQSIKNASGMIEAEHPEADPKGYALQSNEIAERAAQLIRGGLTKDEAYQQAFGEIKESGKLDKLAPRPADYKKQQAAAGLQEEVSGDIDDLISQIEADPSVVGGRGKIGQGAEFVKGVTGFGSQDNPATRFQTDVTLLKGKLHKAMIGTKSAKDQRELVNAVADLGRIGNSGPTALTKLREIKKKLGNKASEPATIKGKGDKGGEVISLSDYLKSQGY